MLTSFYQILCNLLFEHCEICYIYIIGVGWTNETDEPLQKEKEEVCNFKWVGSAWVQDVGSAPLCFENHTFVCYYKTSFLKSTRKHSDFHPWAFWFFHLFCRKTNFCRVNHTLLSYNSRQRYGILGNKTNIEPKKYLNSIHSILKRKIQFAKW